MYIESERRVGGYNIVEVKGREGERVGITWWRGKGGRGGLYM